MITECEGFDAGLVLASQSERRKEILTLAGYSFSVYKSGFDESLLSEIKDAKALVEESSFQKATTSSKSNKNSFILAADTIVYCDNLIFGKPKDEADAKQMLKSMSGKIHFVYTGVTIFKNFGRSETRTFSDVTEVEFYELSEKEIDEYLLSKEPFGKAGAYTIGGIGSCFIKKINGSCHNVLGLPIALVYKNLNEMGYKKLDSKT